jgi:hypothetical protein
MNRNELIEKISAAFGNISLEDGIGILESEAIDCCVSDKNREKARNDDYREKWQSIPDEIISEHYSALCFMDAKGLRFNLPAYMTFALKYYDSSNSASIDGVIYALCKDPEELETDWSVFSDEQRNVIALFLRYMVTEVGEQWIDVYQASLAYEKSWCIYDEECT